MFVKRNHCKSELIVGNTYLIMGNDGSTRDSDGRYVAIHETSVLPESTVKKWTKVTAISFFFPSMKYLLDSKTWVEQKPTASACLASVKKEFCRGFKMFMKEYQVDGCDV